MPQMLETSATKGENPRLRRIRVVVPRRWDFVNYIGEISISSDGCPPRAEALAQFMEAPAGLKGCSP